MTAATKKMRIDLIPLTPELQAERTRVEAELADIFDKKIPEINRRTAALYEETNALLRICLTKELYKSTHRSFEKYLKSLFENHPSRAAIYRQVTQVVMQDKLLRLGIEDSIANSIAQNSAGMLKKVPAEKLVAVIDTAKQYPSGVTADTIKEAISVVSPESIKPRKTKEKAQPSQQATTLKLHNPEPEQSQATAEEQVEAVAAVAVIEQPKLETQPTAGRDLIAEHEEYFASQDPLMQQAIINRLRGIAKIEDKPAPPPEEPKPQPPAPAFVVSYEPEEVVKQVLTYSAEVQVSVVTKIIAKTTDAASQGIITYIASEEPVAFLANTLTDGKARNLHRLISGRLGKFIIPTVEEIQSYLKEKGWVDIDAEEFHAAYDRQGWKLANGNPMTSWKGAVTTWRKMREKETASNKVSKIHPDVFDPSKGLKSGRNAL